MSATCSPDIAPVAASSSGPRANPLSSGTSASKARAPSAISVSTFSKSFAASTFSRINDRNCGSARSQLPRTCAKATLARGLARSSQFRSGYSARDSCQTAFSSWTTSCSHHGAIWTIACAMACSSVSRSLLRTCQGKVRREDLDIVAAGRCVSRASVFTGHRGAAPNR